MANESVTSLQSAMTAIEEAAEAVRREVESGRLGDSAVARLSATEADLRRSRLVLEKIVREVSEER
ncbi:hypothetical protein E0L93_01970 [Rubrobacter taiwanensis]|jgi:hypothetical protein|uniref:Uncharacterized protein n=1 Tax=Rubrobacter taiwanensis TaxID=185139 RepID=A0A4R1BSS9_9ACTN|nr:hypothetical protein [Rubrobacter taiwanensis]TCJ20295.1 hypothetical protein E0L93_01970 [Rubrobacter taiwanensis]